MEITLAPIKNNKADSANLPEVEAFLEIMKDTNPEIIRGKTYKEIAEVLTDFFGLKVREDQVSLLHEPDIEAEMTSMEIWYRSMGFN